jgi:hypothetical protein
MISEFGRKNCMKVIGYFADGTGTVEREVEAATMQEAIDAVKADMTAQQRSLIASWEVEEEFL